MEEVVLKARSRNVVGKQVRALRRQGKLPAVIYGGASGPQPILLDYREAVRILPGVSSSQLITVEVDGTTHATLVREKQHQPVTGSLLHVDFQKVSMTEKLRVTVGIVLVGESPAVTNYNGVIVTGVEDLEVQCLPGDMPERITVDISILNEIGNAIYVRDIHLPPEVEVLTELQELVVVVTAQEAEEVEEVVVEEVTTVEPEVIEKGKKEEEEF